MNIEQIKIEKLTPSPHNPRRIADNDPGVQELAASIKENGLLQPITARPSGKGYEIVAGERRWRACRAAGLKTIHAIVREMDDRTAREVCTLENLQRENLTPLEEARGVAALLADGWDYRAVADRLGKAPSWVARRAAIDMLVVPVRDAYEAADGPISRWTAAHLELVARMPAEEQKQWWEDLRDWDRDHLNDCTVADLRDELEEHQRDLGKVPWDVHDADAAAGRPACFGCQARTSAQPDLFDDAPKKGDRCLSRACYDAKAETWRTNKIDELRQKYPTLAVADGGVRIKGLTVRTYEYQDAKKGEPGAIPVLSMQWNKATIQWMKPNKVTKKAAASDPEAERQQKVARRRGEYVIESLSNRLEKLKKRPDNIPPLRVVALAVSREVGGGAWAAEEPTLDALAAAAWDDVVEYLYDLIIDDPRARKLVAEMVGANLTALERDAILKFPDAAAKEAGGAKKSKKAAKI